MNPCLWHGFTACRGLCPLDPLCRPCQASKLEYNLNIGPPMHTTVPIWIIRHAVWPVTTQTEFWIRHAAGTSVTSPNKGEISAKNQSKSSKKGTFLQIFTCHQPILASSRGSVTCDCWIIWIGTVILLLRLQVTWWLSLVLAFGTEVSQSLPTVVD